MRDITLAPEGTFLPRTHVLVYHGPTLGPLTDGAYLRFRYYPNSQIIGVSTGRTLITVIEVDPGNDLPLIDPDVEILYSLTLHHLSTSPESREQHDQISWEERERLEYEDALTSLAIPAVNVPGLS